MSDETLLTDTDDTNVGDEDLETSEEETEEETTELDLITPDLVDEEETSEDDEGEESETDEESDEEGEESTDDAEEEGEPIVTVPEGIIVDKAIMTKFEEVVTELGIEKEGAQKLFDLQVELSKKADDDFQAERAEWVETISKDEEYGGDNLEASRQAARKAMKRFSTPELRDLLKLTGFGDHPELFKTMVNIGRAMGEADFIDGPFTLQTGPKDPADVLFGDMTKDD